VLGVHRLAEFCHLAKVWQMTDTEAEVQVVTLAEELQDLVGWPTTFKLVSLRTLCSLESVRQQLPSGSFPNAVAALVWSEIRAATEDLAGEHSFNISKQSVTVSAEQARQGYSWLLRLNGEEGEADDRRRQCIDALGLTGRVAVRTWRAEPELNFMRILARGLIRRSQRDQGPKYYCERTDKFLWVDERGAWVGLEAHFRIRALTDGLTTLVARSQYPTDPRPGVMKLRPLYGCDVTRVEEDQEGLGILRVTLTIPLRNHDQTHRYGYRINLNTDQPCERMFTIEPATDIGFMLMRVHFHPRRQPGVVWFFDNLADLDVPGEPNSRNRLSPLGDGSYVKEFRNLKARWCYGIAWRWPTAGV